MARSRTNRIGMTSRQGAHRARARRHLATAIGIAVTGTGTTLASAGATATDDQAFDVIVAPDGATDPRFGRAVLVAGDWACVASDAGPDGTPRPGTIAFVAWAELARGTPRPSIVIEAAPADGPDGFGFAMAATDDLLLVGAPADARHGLDGGAAFLFDLADPLAPPVRLEAPRTLPLARFGAAVAIDGDRLVIGAPRDDGGALDAGAAHVYRFDRDGNGWLHEARLTHPDPAEADFFGHAVAIEGDVIAIGCHGDDDHGEKSGSVFVHRLVEGAWIREATLHAPDPIRRERFGHAVELDDGTLFVARPFRDRSRGAIDLFRVDRGAWSVESTLVDPTLDGHAWMGWAFAVEDGVVLAGAPGATGAIGFDGALVRFERSPTGWALRGRIAAPRVATDPFPPWQFGWSISLADDRVLVGRVDDPDAPTIPGRAWGTSLDRLRALDAAPDLDDHVHAERPSAVDPG